MMLSGFLENKVDYGHDQLHVISTSDIIKEIGEEGFKSLVSNFYCPHDKDIELFLKSKSIAYEKSDFSRTYLICIEKENDLTVVAYFAIAMKPFFIHKNCSKSFKKKLHGQFSNTEIITGALIGQISKNFYKGLEQIISGKDIVILALEKITDVFKMIGVRVVYLECRDIECLRAFYERLGFVLYRDVKGNPIKSEDGLLCYIARTDKFLPQN